MKGNRKFYIAGGALVFGFVLSLIGKLTGDFVAIASVAVGAFSAANAFEHFAGQKGNKESGNA
jgi:hypothetical protein